MEEMNKEENKTDKTDKTDKTYKPEIIPNENDIKKVSILDMFPTKEMTEAGNGTYKLSCPYCGLQGGRTEGFIIFPDSNTAFCHSSGKWFRMLEAYALRKKIINCIDGRDPGEKDKKVLGGELFTLTLDEFKNEYGTEKYNQLIEDLNIRKRIELPGNNRYISDFCDELANIYKSRNILFQRVESGDVVQIDRYREANSTSDDEGEITMERGFKKVDPDEFSSSAEKFIKPWTRLFTKSGGEIIVNRSMTVSQAKSVISSEEFKKRLPAMKRIFTIQIPTLYKNNLSFPKKGYDKRYCSWLPYNAPQIRPTMFNLEQAKTIINLIFEEFCFASEKDKTHAIAAFITPFCRGLFPNFATRTPVFIYMANRERAGKDYCAGCSGMLYEGLCTEEPPICGSEDDNVLNSDELRKKITACLIQGKKRFHSSNNKGHLNSSVFEMATTMKTWSDRILGHSKLILYNNEMDYSLSGNLGIKLTPDLMNRGRIINLHLVDEDANARTFKNPRLHEWIFDNRITVISAIYKLVENWFEMGCPDGSIPFTSFPEWAKIVGGIMEAAGYENPCSRDDSMTDGLIALDSETEEMKQLFETCYDKHPNQFVKKKDIQEIIEKEGIMMYYDFNNRSDQIKFAQKIDRFANRMLSGILMKVDSKDKQKKYREYMFYKKEEQQSQQSKQSLPVTYITLKGCKNDTTNIAVIADIAVKNNIETKEINKDNIDYQAKNNIVYDKDNIVYKSENTEKNALKISISNSKNPLYSEQKITTFDEAANISKQFLAKEMEAKIDKPREKTNRELQFYEDPQCDKIVEMCTKEQVLEWVKNNPLASYENLYDTLGLGCFKHIGTLINEGLIKAYEDNWEAVNGTNV